MFRLFTLLAHLLFVCGMVIFTALPKNKYDWMQDFDPSISAGAVEDASANRVLLTLLCLLAIVLTQLVLLARSKTHRGKIVSGVLIAVALAVWCIRFGS